MDFETAGPISMKVTGNLKIGLAGNSGFGSDRFKVKPNIGTANWAAFD